MSALGWCQYCGNDERMLERSTCAYCSFTIQGGMDGKGVKHDAKPLPIRFHSIDGGEIVPDELGHAMCVKCRPEEFRRP
jgi:hypothetical protein